MYYAVRHCRYVRIMRNDDCCGAQFPVYTLKRLKHNYAGGGIQRPGRFVAEKDLGVF